MLNTTGNALYQQCFWWLKVVYIWSFLLRDLLSIEIGWLELILLASTPACTLQRVCNNMAPLVCR